MPKVISLKRGFKILDKEFKCGYFKYKVGKTYQKKPKDPTGFSFCTHFSHLFDEQPKELENVRVVEIYIYDDITTPIGTNRYWRNANKITVIRELSLQEIQTTEALAEMFIGFVDENSKENTQTTVEKLEEMIDTLSHLEEKMKFILGMRLCAVTGRPETLALIGEKLGISRERVRQLLERTVKQLLSPFNLSTKKDTTAYPDIKQIYNKVFK